MQPPGGRGTHFVPIQFAMIVALCLAAAGCASSEATSGQPDVQDHLKKLFNVYKAYVDKNQKGPPSEQALREFAQSLSPPERADCLIPDDLESVMTSPRDHKKIVVQYGVKLDPSKNRAIAWEADGKDGLRYVALSIGYISLYDEKTLNESKK